jgi:hypothetical protein
MMRWKKITIIIVILFFLLGGTVFFLFNGKDMVDTQSIAINTLSAMQKVTKFLPIQDDTKRELDVISKLTEALAKKDDVERSYMVLLQNNLELRPGGGFLGQYAIIKIKNGEVVSHFIEDANLLDQRITTKVTPPYPFRRMMSLKRWKFRDSNYSPDYPTNVEKAEYFYRLAGRASDFDGVIAVNADVLNEVLKITGPITVPGYPGEYNSENAVLKLEEQVEKGFETQGINVQDRKLILKSMGKIIIERLTSMRNIPKIAEFSLEQLRNKNIMLNFKDQNLQQMVASVHWDGSVAQDWNGDYLMVVDANMGALKSDYYVKRSLKYEVDLTGEKPVATLYITYNHTAKGGDWRTSDYHSYLRILTPKGSTLLEREMVSYPSIQEELNKTSMGFILHALIGRTTTARIKYELPVGVKDSYRLLIQKQSGVGDLPVVVKVKTAEGEFEKNETIKKDLQMEFLKQ